MNTPITINMPAHAINAMPLRLFVSGLASRMGFDVETIEDIKTAVSEICVMLLGSVEEGMLEIIINTNKKLDISASINSAVYIEKDDEDDISELSRMLVEALADEVSISEDENSHVNNIQMIFKLGE